MVDFIAFDFSLSFLKGFRHFNKRSLDEDKRSKFVHFFMDNGYVKGMSISGNASTFSR